MQPQRNIFLHNKEISYKLKKYKRSRSLRVHVREGGEVTVTAPARINESAISGFLSKHAEWIFAKILYFKQFTKVAVVGPKKAHYKEHKEKAREIISERVAHYNAFYNFSYNRISIKNTSSRWGSCSTKGNLNFSYKLIFLQPELLDYVVVHELCHLKEMNHGTTFWKLVAEACPNYKEYRKKLSKYKI